MRGINDTNKREEGLDIFKKRKFDLLALTDTKLKGRGEVSWCEVNGIISGVREMERGIMVKGRWYHCHCSEDGKCSHPIE